MSSVSSVVAKSSRRPPLKPQRVHREGSRAGQVPGPHSTCVPTSSPLAIAPSFSPKVLKGHPFLHEPSSEHWAADSLPPHETTLTRSAGEEFEWVRRTENAPTPTMPRHFRGFRRHPLIPSPLAPAPLRVLGVLRGSKKLARASGTKHREHRGAQRRGGRWLLGSNNRHRIAIRAAPLGQMRIYPVRYGSFSWLRMSPPLGESSHRLSILVPPSSTPAGPSRVGQLLIVDTSLQSDLSSGLEGSL